jgi:hypothetical protein
MMITHCQKLLRNLKQHKKKHKIICNHNLTFYWVRVTLNWVILINSVIFWLKFNEYDETWWRLNESALFANFGLSKYSLSSASWQDYQSLWELHSDKYWPRNPLECNWKVNAICFAKSPLINLISTRKFPFSLNLFIERNRFSSKKILLFTILLKLRFF